MRGYHAYNLRVFIDKGNCSCHSSKVLLSWNSCVGRTGSARPSRNRQAYEFCVIPTMLYETNSTSLIERARSAKDGVLLQRVIDLERARLREHGSKDGLDKFKASSIKLFKNPSDFVGFKKDCVTAFQHFHSGLECLNLLAHFNKKEHGIDPDNDVLLRMTCGFDSNMATRTQIALGRKIDAFKLLDKYESGRDRLRAPTQEPEP